MDNSALESTFTDNMSDVNMICRVILNARPRVCVSACVCVCLSLSLSLSATALVLLVNRFRGKGSRLSNACDILLPPHGCQRTIIAMLLFLVVIMLH